MNPTGNIELFQQACGKSMEKNPNMSSMLGEVQAHSCVHACTCTHTHMHTQRAARIDKEYAEISNIKVKRESLRQLLNRGGSCCTFGEGGEGMGNFLSDPRIT